LYALDDVDLIERQKSHRPLPGDDLDRLVALNSSSVRVDSTCIMARLLFISGT